MNISPMEFLFIVKSMKDIGMKLHIYFAYFVLWTMGVSHAQIPVIDASNLQQQIQQVTAWASQLRAMTDQYAQQLQQYQSLTGNRGFGNLLNDPKLRQYLPNEWQQVYQRLQASGLGGLSRGAQSVRQKMGSTYNCAEYKDSIQRQRCEQAIGKSYQDFDIFQTALDVANQKTTQIQGLVEQIANTDDPKSIAELQARISGEQAALQNEMNRMQLSIRLADIQNQIMKQKALEERIQNLEANKHYPIPKLPTDD